LPQVTNISLDEMIAIQVLNILEVIQVSRIGQVVQVGYMQSTAMVQDMMDEIRPDKSRAACDEDIFHIF
jgi:hypothetical protein